MNSSDLIGIDIGKKHTGLARASTVAKIAEPLTTLPTDQVVAKIQELLKEKKIDAIAVGLPRNLSGDETEQTKWVRHWVSVSKKEVGVPFYWVDEALTSSGEKNDHSGAAVAILQDFVNTADEEKVPC